MPESDWVKTHQEVPPMRWPGAAVGIVFIIACATVAIVWIVYG